MSLTKKASPSMVRAAIDEALEGYAGKLAWHVRRTWNGPVEILLKKRGDYSEIDILEATEDAKKALLSTNIL